MTKTGTSAKPAKPGAKPSGNIVKGKPPQSDGKGAKTLGPFHSRIYQAKAIEAKGGKKK